MLHRAKKMMKNIEISPKRKNVNFLVAQVESQSDTKPTPNEDLDTLKTQVNNLKDELSSKDSIIKDLREKLSADPQRSPTDTITRLEEKLKASESDRKRLEEEHSIFSKLILHQRQLIEKLEAESNRMSQVYSKLSASQNRLISTLEAKYNEILYSLIDSFEEIDFGSSFDSKVDEIQSDLNSLIQILGHESSQINNESLEKPLNDESPNSMASIRRVLSDQYVIESQDTSFSNMSWTPNYDESVYIDFKLDDSFNSERSNRNSFNSSVVPKCDFECQCKLEDLNETTCLTEQNKSLSAELEAKTNEIQLLKETISQLESKSKSKQVNPPSIVDFKLQPLDGKTETGSLEELISSYLNLIKGYRSLVEQLDQARLDNSELKISYNSLNEKYMTLKSSGQNQV